MREEKAAVYAAISSPLPESLLHGEKKNESHKYEWIEMGFGSEREVLRFSPSVSMFGWLCCFGALRSTLFS